MGGFSVSEIDKLRLVFERELGLVEPCEFISFFCLKYLPESLRPKTLEHFFRDLLRFPTKARVLAFMGDGLYASFIEKKLLREYLFKSYPARDPLTSELRPHPTLVVRPTLRAFELCYPKNFDLFLEHWEKEYDKSIAPLLKDYNLTPHRVGRVFLFCDERLLFGRSLF